MPSGLARHRGRCSSIPVLARSWWALALRGLCALVFGVAALAWPGLTLAVLVLLYGAYALADGLLALIASFSTFSNKGWEDPWWALIFEGIAGIAAGVLSIALPGITAMALVYPIAAWSVATGVFEIVGAVQLRNEVPGERMLGSCGVLSIVFGVGLAIAPENGGQFLGWLIGAYAVLFGILLMTLAFRLRRRANQIPAAVESYSPPA